MAHAAGFATPREWKSRMTAREYEELIAVASRQPFGPDRRDLGIAIAAYVIASTFGAKGLNVADLFPVRKRADSPEQIYQTLLSYSTKWNHKHGGNDCKPGSETEPR